MKKTEQTLSPRKFAVQVVRGMQSLVDLANSVCGSTLQFQQYSWYFYLNNHWCNFTSSWCFLFCHKYNLKSFCVHFLVLRNSQLEFPYMWSVTENWFEMHRVNECNNLITEQNSRYLVGITHTSNTTLTGLRKSKYYVEIGLLSQFDFNQTFTMNEQHWNLSVAINTLVRRVKCCKWQSCRIEKDLELKSIG